MGFLFFFKILDIPTLEAFSCNTDGNLASEWEKWKKRFQYYVAAAGLKDDKQKWAVLLNLIGPPGQEIFDRRQLRISNCKFIKLLYAKEEFHLQTL